MSHAFAEVVKNLKMLYRCKEGTNYVKNFQLQLNSRAAMGGRDG